MSYCHGVVVYELCSLYAMLFDNGVGYIFLEGRLGISALLILQYSGEFIQNAEPRMKLSITSCCCLFDSVILRLTFLVTMVGSASSVGWDY